jgi:glycosyltransferase involved in cell wall biosynthesis
MNASSPFTTSSNSRLAESARHLRLGFVTDRPAYLDDAVWVDVALGRLIGALRAQVDKFTMAISRIDHQRPWLCHKVEMSADTIFAMPRNPSFARGFFNVFSCRRAIREVERRSDVVLVQLPFSAGLALLGSRGPRVYQVCADLHEVVSNSIQYRGPKKLIARAGAAFLDRIQKHLIARNDARFVAHGKKLWTRYGTEFGRAVVSSSIYANEIQSVSRTRPADAPFRILFVGYLRHWKGVDVLCDAIEEVSERLPDVELVFVGAKDSSGPDVEAPLRRQIENLSRKNSIRFLGHREFGPELFQCYADADVLAVPSRSEGTPRVLIEARAFGCPVVGSRVGGIPTSIEHEVDGLLVPCGDASALADAILRIAHDVPLRNRLIATGLERARKTTVDSLAEAILAEAMLVSARN